MTELHLLYACFGLAALLMALSSRALRRLPLSEPLVGILLGVALGPAVLGLLTISEPLRDVLLLEGSRLLLAGSVMAAALRYPAHDLRSVLRAVVVLLAVAMPLAALVSTVGALVLGLPLALAVVVGACLCPTDPVLAASVVTGEPAERDIPARVRRMITAESGANDGLALPIVGIAIAVALPAESPSDVVGRLAWEVVGGTLVGIAMGALAAWGLRVATRHRDFEPGPELVYSLLLAVTTLGVARVAHTGGVLAVFVAGVVYNRLVAQEDRGPQDTVDEAVNRYAVIPLFVLLGAVLPWREWAAFGPAALAFVAVVLLLRRPPIVLALTRALGLDVKQAAFTGWFGPIGVSAVFYLAHSLHEGVTDPRVFAAGTLAIAASVVAFGLSGSPGRALYARTPERAGSAARSGT